ncbi:endopeptidase La [Prosthecobacter sp.]|uniref:endopeptidase La n=1 Tax=Prosthecobacter sp. TaxID=1965333 RepID=UPI002ABBBF31|nr:endopeptidase La [Prosthecobacter sp.]MDZ4403594.1 endopeptidase La [Prosthecobacter sp.]
MTDTLSLKGAETTAATTSVASSADADGPPVTLVPGAVEVLPILPLRDTVLFPGTIMPLSIGRASSLQLLEESLTQSKLLGLVLQKDKESENPSLEHLHEHGVIGRVIRMIRQDKGVVILVRGEQRMRIKQVTQQEPFMKAEVETLSSQMPSKDDDMAEAAVRNLRESAEKLLSLRPEVSDEVKAVFSTIEDASTLTDILAANLSIETEAKQKLLEETHVARRVAALEVHLHNQLHIADLQSKLRENVSSEFSEAQKRAYLREQLRAIQKELGEDGSGEEQVEDLRQRLDKAGLPEKAKMQADRELKRLEIIPPQSPDHSVIVNYLETLAELPWNVLSDEKVDLHKAQEILDRDHYGLAKVKKRLIEYLAVRKLNPTGRGAILCFLGPPGVGKTSLGQSIAEALGRKFARISLGGLRDESEIRGHRRTYIGSMPGRLIQELKRLGTRNPVLMLDEIDKLGADFRGDPASALLEVLDPRQNQEFTDRYIDVPFDLSQIIFIATCNTLDSIPAPLRDRMEIVELSGYTEREKLNIAKNYIVKRQLTEHGLTEAQCTWSDEAIERVIEDYTREAGVRNLERQIASVTRHIAAGIAKEEITEAKVTPGLVRESLGPPAFVRESKLQTSTPGVVTGLAYTTAGGEVLHIEAIKFPGKGGFTLTGQLGDVMKESVRAALSLVRSRAAQLGIDPKVFDKNEVHVHVPAGAVPKDGPSAGIAMFTALASLFSNRRVSKDVAMTGEVTLRGLVLPIGGLKEKSIAALRAGIKTIIIPKLNEKDVPDLPDEVRQRLKIIPVETVDEVLAAALEPAAKTV